MLDKFPKLCHYGFSPTAAKGETNFILLGSSLRLYNLIF